MQTAQQIVTLATQIAKCPGMTQQTGQMLNILLSRLAYQYDNNLLRKSGTISVVNQGPYNLPPDYLRMRQVTYLLNGVSFDVVQIPLEKYNDLVQTTGLTSTYPYNFAIDSSVTPNILYLYPPPSQAFTLNILYMSAPSDITSPETSTSIPWFPHQDYLIHALATEMMKITDDTRYGDFEAVSDELLRRYMRMADDDEGYCKTVKLDPNSFRTGGRVRPTKIQGT
jgi:hypothetical protein